MCYMILVALPPEAQQQWLSRLPEGLCAWERLYHIGRSFRGGMEFSRESWGDSKTLFADKRFKEGYAVDG